MGEGEPWIIYEGPVPTTNWVGNVAIRPDGTGNHWATPHAPISSGDAAGDGWQLHPDWSPDGTKLAFVVDTFPSPDGGHRDIWVSNADGSESRQVYDCASPCDQAEFPAWSKDGKSVLFIRWDVVDEQVDGSVMDVVNVETGDVTTIAETHGAEYFAYSRWSPDGHAVVTQFDTWTDTGLDSTLVSTQVAIVDLTTSPATITKLTEPALGARYPDWHPTQDRLVFETGPLEPQVGEQDLYTMRADGSEMAALIDDPRTNAGQPTWLPDGSGVMFIRLTSTDIGSARMYTILRDGTGLASATSNVPQFGTHPRLRPLP